MIKDAIKFPAKKEMVTLATRDGLDEDAAIWSLAYDRLFRVANELLPLETRQAVLTDPLTTPWHSCVIWEFNAVGLHPVKCHIHLRKRKNTGLPSIMDLE